jgi:hypothetical protein
MEELKDDFFDEFFRKQDAESTEIVNNIIIFIDKQINSQSIDTLNRKNIAEFIVEYLNVKDQGITRTELHKIFDHYSQKIGN